jgi:putative Mg2+ transporter-C (MgtC) family protein
LPERIRADRRFVRVVTDNKQGTITEITSYLAENGVKVKTLNVKTAANKKQLVLEIYLKVDKEMDANTIISGIQDINGVISLENIN